MSDDTDALQREDWTSTVSMAVVIGFMGILVLFALIAALLPRPSRECPKCGHRVPLTAPRCRRCKYQFAPDGSLPRYMR